MENETTFKLSIFMDNGIVSVIDGCEWEGIQKFRTWLNGRNPFRSRWMGLISSEGTASSMVDRKRITYLRYEIESK